MKWTTSEQLEVALPPNGSGRVIEFRWKPQRTTDEVEYAIDWTPMTPQGSIKDLEVTNGSIEEMDETNNRATNILSSVDAHQPVVSLLELDNPQLDGDPNPGIWGRYVSEKVDLENEDAWFGPKPRVVFEVKDNDGDGVIGYWEWPTTLGIQSLEERADWNAELIAESTSDGNGIRYTTWPQRFGQLPPTQMAQNRYRVRAVDPYGLESLEDAVRTVNVVDVPHWTTEVAWDETKMQYRLSLHKKLINQLKATHEWMDVDDPDDVPLIGGLESGVLAQIDSDVYVNLDPTVAYTDYLNGLIHIKLLGYDLFNREWKGQTDLSDNVTLSTSVLVHGDDLSASVLASVQFTNIDLFNWESPEIQLVSYGIPGIAELEATGSVYVDLSLDAAATIAIDEKILQGDIFPPPLPVAVAAPTYVVLHVDSGLTASAAAEIIGFDLLSVDTNIELNFDLTLGLDGPFGTVIPIEEFFGNPLENLGFKIDGDFGMDLDVEVLGIEIVDIDIPNISFNVLDTSDNGIYVGPVFPPLSNSSGQQSDSKNSRIGDSKNRLPPNGNSQPRLQVDPKPFVLDPLPPAKSGSSLVGELSIDPGPNISINSLGQGIYVQAMNANSEEGPVLGNLGIAFQSSSSESWTELQMLVGDRHVIRPTAKWIGETGTALVAFNAISPPASGLSSMTVNDYFAGQEVAYRVFDGENWSEEISLSDNNVIDTQPVISFNSSGDGVIAWTRSVGSPNGEMIGEGVVNDLWVSRWDPVTMRFLAPLNLTETPTINDALPSAFVDEAGKIYLAWIQNGKTVFHAEWDGTNWSTPAPLGIIGVPLNSQAKSVAIGTNGIASDGSQSINVIINYDIVREDGSKINSIFNRPGTAATFSVPRALELVSKDGTSFPLQVAQSRNGELAAYWIRNQGNESNVVMAKLGNAGQAQFGVVPRRSHRVKRESLLPRWRSMSMATFNLLIDRKSPTSQPSKSERKLPFAAIPHLPRWALAHAMV